MTKKVNTLSLTPGYTGGRPNEFRYNLGSELKNGLFYRPDKKKKKKIRHHKQLPSHRNTSQSIRVK